MIAVSGVAGSGKTTLGRALAKELRLPLLDLDTLTVPLLDQLHGTLFGDHWLAPAHAPAVRPARYSVLRATASEVVATAGGAVLVAPFTAELTGGRAWTDLLDAVAPAELRMVNLRGSAKLFARRRAERSEPRDQHRADTGPAASPAVPHLSINARLTPGQQRFRVLRALGRRTPLDLDSPVFARSFDAVLFDLDGVLADSTASVLRSWDQFADEMSLPAAVVESNHGRPARPLVQRLLPADQVDDGLRRIEDIEAADVLSIEPVPGAGDFISRLPDGRRAVVTSGTRRIATARLAAAGIAAPPVLVSADDVRCGKPDPEPYVSAAARLGVAPARCLVVEDAPAGVEAARAAGCGVIGVLGTVEPSDLSGADLLVDGLDRLRVDHTPAGLRLAAVDQPAAAGG
ncbi:HAD-IA family hydrolase [Streptomyces mayonensis]|uniref:HAD-IA family hydrolase n=1 Tax=Streptomyces mayonensis TaxID=2750816 RepID=UPI0027E3D089|nr:HAD-IA family hydrolase [Streptomyces sp. A108]